MESPLDRAVVVQRSLHMSQRAGKPVHRSANATVVKVEAEQDSPVSVVPSHPPTVFSVCCSTASCRVGRWMQLSCIYPSPLTIVSSAPQPNGHVSLLPTARPNSRRRPTADPPRPRDGCSRSPICPSHVSSVPSAARQTGHVITRPCSGSPPTPAPERC